MFQSGIVTSFAMPIAGLGMQCLSQWMDPRADSVASTVKKATTDNWNDDDGNGEKMRLQGMTVQRWGALLVLLSNAVHSIWRGQHAFASLLVTGSFALGVFGDGHPYWKHVEENSEAESWGQWIGKRSDQMRPAVDVVVKMINLYPLFLHGSRLWNMGGLTSQIVAGSAMGLGGTLTIAAIVLDPPKPTKSEAVVD